MPVWLLEDYLQNVGGVKQHDGTIVGEGWHAAITPMDDFQIGSLRVGQVRVVITGDQPTLDGLWAKLEHSLLRAGG